MTYIEFIDNIIQNRGQFNIPKEEYKEMHHIVPRCLGGDSDYADGHFKRNSHHPNCVWLYAREHLIAHKLLAKENPQHRGLISAYVKMACEISSNHIGREISPEEYEEARILFAQSQMGENNPIHGHEMRGEQNGMYGIRGANHVSSISVYCIELGKEFAGASEAARKLGYSDGSAITACCKGKKGSYKGHHWCYASDKDKIKDEELSQLVTTNNRRAVYCIELDKVFDSSAEAQRQLNICANTIRKCCKDEKSSFTAGRYHWCYIEYKDDEAYVQAHVNKSKGKSGPKSTKEQKVYCIELDQSFDSIILASKATNAPAKGIEMCCCRLQHTSGGYHWCYAKYQNNNSYINEIVEHTHLQSISVYCVELGRTFNSAKQASIELGVDSSSITKCCKGKAQTVGGYHWQYSNE